MIYTKPKNVSYTDMAIWLDSNVYVDDEDRDDDKIFEYLYHLGYMLARKARYFKSTDQLEMFAIELATAVYLRLTNPKQYEIVNGKARLNKIKSVLNYMKSVLYPRKVAFEQTNYAQSETAIDEPEQQDLTSGYTFANYLQDMANSLVRIDFESYLETIPQTIKSYVKQLPYKSYSVEWYNVYMSCLLSFLNSITLPIVDLQRIRSLKYESNRISAINFWFDTHTDYVILYHLPESMHDYIQVQTLKIRRLIASDLSEMINTEIDTHSLNDGIIRKELYGDYDEVR